MTLPGLSPSRSTSPSVKILSYLILAFDTAQWLPTRTSACSNVSATVAYKSTRMSSGDLTEISQPCGRTSASHGAISHCHLPIPMAELACAWRRPIGVIPPNRTPVINGFRLLPHGSCNNRGQRQCRSPHPFLSGLFGRRSLSFPSARLRHATLVSEMTIRYIACVYQKPKPGRSGDEVRKG